MGLFTDAFLVCNLRCLLYNNIQMHTSQSGYNLERKMAREPSQVAKYDNNVRMTKYGNLQDEEETKIEPSGRNLERKLEREASQVAKSDKNVRLTKYVPKPWWEEKEEEEKEEEKKKDEEKQDEENKKAAVHFLHSIT
eukprot:Platyproteum_vivax@DN5632_c0_g1_i1.p1